MQEIQISMQEIQISMREIQISMREIQGKSKKRSKTSLDNFVLISKLVSHAPSYLNFVWSLSDKLESLSSFGHWAHFTFDQD